MVCQAAALLGARVVTWCGERPGGDAEGFTAWRTPSSDSVWQARLEGHYLRDLQTPVLRYLRPPDTGGEVSIRLVDVRSSGEWFGDHNDVSPQVAALAMEVVRDVLRDRFWGSRVWVSPQATGTDLLLRALPEGRSWSPLPAELAAQVQATATQGRVETFTLPGPLPAVVEYDMRFAYAALCADLPEGEPHFGDGWPDPEAHGYLPGTEPAMCRGRFDVEWRAPAGWAHVGLVPHLGRNGWVWPVDRRWHRDWVDGAEVLLAQRKGWELKCRRHLIWPRPFARGPLAVWADELVGAREQADRLTCDDLELNAAVTAALRAVVLTTIGVLHGRGHTVTRTAALDEALPRGRLDRLHTQGDQYVWQGQGAPARPEFVHPEWSASIWSRCRARLLEGPPVAKVRTGALHVDPSTLLAFSVDALYLTADPGWPDDGRVGRLRHKATHVGPHEPPADRASLLALLRDRRKEPV
jgi:hypothetical protein